MNRNNIVLLTIGISLLIDFIVSAIIAAGFFIVGYHFFSTLLITFGVLFLAGNLWNMYLQTRDRAAQQLIEASDRLARSQQEVELACAVCHKLNIIPVILNKDNEFGCSYCKQPNRVMMDFSTVQITTPLSPALDVNVPQNVIQENI